jgi:GT2 family glycosyltransferase
MSAARVLLIVPTLGRRPDYLEKCLASISEQSMRADIIIVAPVSPELESLAVKHGARLIADPGSQTSAINLAAAMAQPHHEFINWLGDDDLLEPGSLALTTRALDANPDAVVAYGACRYINENDAELWVNQAGPWANRILKWGPDLIPQPGMLVRTSAWQKVGGVDESFRFAFDLDLLLKLQVIGRLIDVGQVVSSFRWHADSLTVGDRSENLRESEIAKRRALSPRARKLAWLWEKPVRGATRLAANEVVRRARRIERKAQR